MLFTWCVYSACLPNQIHLNPSYCVCQVIIWKPCQIRFRGEKGVWYQTRAMSSINLLLRCGRRKQRDCDGEERAGSSVCWSHFLFCNRFLSSKWKRGYIPIIIWVISEIVIKAMERKLGFLEAVQCATYIEGRRGGEESGACCPIIHKYIYSACIL